VARGTIADVHCHCTLQRFRKAVLEDGGDWHGMTSMDGELDNLKNRWDVGKRLETMDELGIDVQLVSPTDVFYQYHQAPEVTERISREANEEIAGMVRDHPDRFMGLGTLPMQDVDRATREMARGMGELGLTGFMIDDHVNGILYDHDVFDGLWEAAQDLGVFLLIHQYQHTSVAYRTKKYFLLNSIGNLVDRLRLGYVVDFVDMGIGTFRWYTFNVADAAISASIALLLAMSLWPWVAERARRRRSGGGRDDPAPDGWREVHRDIRFVAFRRDSLR